MDYAGLENTISSQYSTFSGKNSQLQIQLGSGGAQQVLKQIVIDWATSSNKNPEIAEKIVRNVS